MGLFSIPMRANGTKAPRCPWPKLKANFFTPKSHTVEKTEVPPLPPSPAGRNIRARWGLIKEMIHKGEWGKLAKQEPTGGEKSQSGVLKKSPLNQYNKLSTGIMAHVVTVSIKID